MQRKCYFILNGEQLFPNLFAFLVGPPGVGKTRAIMPARDALASLNTTTLSSAKSTKEKMLDRLAKSTKMYGGGRTQTAYAAYVDELSTFIKPSDLEFTDILTALFDSPKVWTYEAIKEDRRIENLFFCLLGGIATQTLATNFRPIFGRGFTARVNLVFSDEHFPLDINSQPTIPDYTPMYRRLKEIGKLEGRMDMTPAANAFIASWILANLPPTPKHFRFAEYNARRSLHYLKLCMIFAGARGSLEISLEDAEEAQQTLLGVEKDMNKALEYLSGNPLAEAVKLAHNWLLADYAENGRAISDQRLRQYLLVEIGPQHLEAAIAQMSAASLVKVVIENSSKTYVPQERLV